MNLHIYHLSIKPGREINNRLPSFPNTWKRIYSQQRYTGSCLMLYITLLHKTLRQDKSQHSSLHEQTNNESWLRNIKSQRRFRLLWSRLVTWLAAYYYLWKGIVSKGVSVPFLSFMKFHHKRDTSLIMKHRQWPRIVWTGSLNIDRLLIARGMSYQRSVINFEK